MDDPYDSSRDKTSVLGPTLRFKGDLVAEEDLLIEGSVEGSITHTQRLTIGRQGTIKANVRAQLIVVQGVVEGDLIGEKSVTVLETARLRGNISSPNVSIVDGAQFNGSVDMGTSKAAAAATPAIPRKTGSATG